MRRSRPWRGQPRPFAILRAALGGRQAPLALKDSEGKVDADFPAVMGVTVSDGPPPPPPHDWRS